MKIVICSSDGDTVPLAQRLQEEGHDVRVYITKDKYRGMWEGLAGKFDAASEIEVWNPELAVCLETSLGTLPAQLAKLGISTVGGSGDAHRLESDRWGSLKLVEKCGIEIPETARLPRRLTRLRLQRKATRGCAASSMRTEETSTCRSWAKATTT